MQRESHRELQAELFKDLKDPMDIREREPAVNVVDVERKSRVLGDNFEALSRRMEAFETRFDQITKSIALRSERTMTMISHVQTQINHVSNDLNEKVVQLSAKINERRLSESRTEDLIDRHNTVVRTLESRLTQMHKMLTEQEKQIHGFSSALNEARAELKRLKRND